MKKINEKIKNLFKKESNTDLLKIGTTLVIYFIVFTIFYAGYEYRNVSSIKNKEAREKVEQFKYYITYKGDEDQYTFNEPKTLFALLEEIKDMELDYTEYYEGKTLKAIGGNQNFKIFVNGEEVKSNFFESNSSLLKSKTKITIKN